MPHAARILAVLAPLVLATAPLARGQRTVMIIGDSLSREYAFEFPDLAANGARNWVEILAARRAGDLFFGELETLNLAAIELYCRFGSGDLCDALGDGENDLMRYRYNWAIPTFTAEAYLDNLDGGGASDLIWQGLINPDFGEVDTVVVFLGGNDIDSVYGGIYGGSGDPTDHPMVADLTKDLKDIVADIREESGTVEILLVNVPHVGATPEVKGDHPTDPVKTGRVTDAVNAINDELKTFAAAEGIAYADVATLTIDLLEPDIYRIGGIEFFNSGTATAAPCFMWLGGPISQNFHPNTNGQALIANAIIAALNETYSAGIAPMSNREILEDVIGLESAMPFADWVGAFGLSPGEDGPNDDPENDGLDNLVEFGLDFSPLVSDLHLLPEPELAGGELRITYRPRDQECRYVRIVPQSSSGLDAWIPIPESDLSDNGDGTWTAATGDPFIRLLVELVE